MTIIFSALLFNTSHAVAATKNKKPNMLVIWGDDIGQFNVSAYNSGMMGYKTSNIDRVMVEAQQGVIWDDLQKSIEKSFFTDKIDLCTHDCLNHLLSKVFSSLGHGV